MLTQPSQDELNKLDDYKCCFDKQVDAIEEAKKRSAMQEGKETLPSSEHRQKKSISPLKVFATDAGGSVAQPSHYDFAAEAGLTLSQLMAEDIPTAPVAWQYEKGKSLVPPGMERTLSSRM
jgi:hypothetical protein